MARGDRRKSPKMRQKVARRKLKAREKRAADAVRQERQAARR